MSMTSVKVSNVSLGATERDLKEFFSFSGDILYLEMHSETERSKLAYVTFKDLQGAETAVLLSGATIVDSSVIVTMAPDYQLSPEALSSLGFILGKDAIAKAKSVDEKHQLTSTASARVASLDKKIGFTDKINTGTVAVGEKVKEVDHKYQVSEKTKSAIAAAEQTVSSAGSAIMKNRYVLTGATWVTGAFSKVAKAAEEVGQMAKEKVGLAEEEDKRKVVDEFARVHLSESPKAAAASSEGEESKFSESPEAKKDSEHQEHSQVQQAPPPPVAPAQP
ncbi:hypothetical protein HID58_000856 [Brassica napus]|uniref:RRM domain-containing protein n=1 Tax=Brassica napus TaxID=3708 RepID=A0ABQ8EHQ6_BRANA|nr:hypothetical protein HID58_000856 [Brassica napus]